MRIAVVGLGYVGLVSAACFADLGANVHCIDADRERVEAISRGDMPLYEPGLSDLVQRGLSADRLHLHTCISEGIEHAEIIFIAVGTPSSSDGSADLSDVLSVARSIGQSLQQYALVVTKSTVPVGTSRLVRGAINEALLARGEEIPFDVASNPEFLKEGNAIDDFMKPDRVVVGIDSERARELMTRLYRPILLNNFRVLFMDIASSELTKYAANAMLATRISFMNEIANLCERVGADIHMVRRGVGTDSRIGGHFLYAGCGYGGSCFPKDVKALIHTATQYDSTMEVLQSVERVNEYQKHRLFEKFVTHYGGDVCGRKVAVWGLAFKPGTDDMREAPSLTLISSLLEAGCHVAVYDPVAMEEAKKRLGETVRYARDIYDCALDVDVIFHVTEWKEFRMPSWDVLFKAVRLPLIIDGRNVFSSVPEEHGFTRLGIGC